MKLTRALPPWFSLLCLLCLLGVFALAQDPQKGDRVPPGTQSQKKDDESTFRVNVRLVNVFTTGDQFPSTRPVAEVNEDDFQLLDG